MRSFYHFALTYRGKKVPDDKSRLADWMFYDHDFPKHSAAYNEISDYLEGNSPFINALTTFDEIWEAYQMNKIK